ncbi:MAG: DUF1097 domain-containing protein [Anaerolineae bacterium]
MKLKFVPLSLSVGILAAIWTWVSIKLGWPTWAGFIGWAFFFVAGGDAKALWKAGLPMIVGVIFGYLCLYGLKLSGELGIVAISLLVGLAALILVLLMNWEPMALAPASFCGFATFFAFTFGTFKSDNFFAFANIGYTLLGLLIGLGLGWLSVTIPAQFQKGT